VVRRWHSDALRGPGGNTSIGQAYRLVRAVMNTALREGIIARNPARFPGRGVPDKTPNCRNTAASGGTGRGDTWSLRAAVLLAAWGGLRRGEILALRREDVDLKAGAPAYGHAQGTNQSRASLICTNALPEKWKVGGSTPPLPTSRSPRSTPFDLGLRHFQPPRASDRECPAGTAENRELPSIVARGLHDTSKVRWST
jgi:hypothetical protein